LGRKLIAFLLLKMEFLFEKSTQVIGRVVSAGLGNKRFCKYPRSFGAFNSDSKTVFACTTSVQSLQRPDCAIFLVVRKFNKKDSIFYLDENSEIGLGMKIEF
jgi:hypothetical protein